MPQDKYQPLYRKKYSQILRLILYNFQSNYLAFNETRTTRTPAFWGYPPPPHDYPYHWVILDPKSKKKTKSKLQILKIHQNFKLLNF